MIAAFNVLLIVSGAGCAHAEDFPRTRPDRPISIDDVLATEFIGKAEFSQNGRWLTYNLVPPYSSLSDYSYWMRAGGLSGHQLWVLDLADDAPPRLQPGLDPAATNFLFGLSPDSAWVVGLEYKKGKLRLVGCRIGENACVRFEPMPDIRDRYAAALQWNEQLVWVSDDAFLMPVRDPRLPGSEMRNRAQSGTYLWAEWNRAWSGAGSTAAEVVSTSRDRSSDWAKGELLLFDLPTGTSHVVAAGRYAGPLLSPDRERIISARVAERRRPPADAGPVARETHPIFDRRYQLSLIELGRDEVLNPDGPFSVDPGSFTWREDSGAFAVFGWEDGEQPEDGRFYIFDMYGQPLQVIDQQILRFTGSIQSPSFRWWPGPARAVLLKAGLVVHGKTHNGDQAGWFLITATGSVRPLSGDVDMPAAELLREDGDGILVLSSGLPFRLDPRTAPADVELNGVSSVRRLEYRPYASHGWSGESYPLSHLTRSSPDTASLVVDEDASGGDRSVWSLMREENGSRSRSMQIGRPGARILAASFSARAIVVSFRDGAATRLELIRQDGRSEVLATINRHLNGIVAPLSRQVSYRLQNETRVLSREVTSCLLLPPDFEASKRYPVVIEIYPTGAGGNCRTFTEAPAVAPLAGDLWAARGFIYMRPAFPLDLAHTGEDPLGALGDLVDQTISALTNEGFVDPNRVVILGSSQGGIASLVASTQSDKPAAVISLNGWADYFSHYFGARGLMRYFHLDQNGGDNRWRYECRGEGSEHGCPFGFGKSALVDPATYALASPVARAADIEAPVLLVHSDFDYFDMAQYDEMFGALYRAGKEARYVRYWGEGHGPSSPANIIDLWIRIDEFLEENGIVEAE